MDASTLHPECTLGRQTPVCRQLGHEAAFRADQGLRTRHGHRRLGNVVLSASFSGGRQWPTTVCCGHLSQMDTRHLTSYWNFCGMCPSSAYEKGTLVVIVGRDVLSERKNVSLQGRLLNLTEAKTSGSGTDLTVIGEYSFAELHKRRGPKCVGMGKLGLCTVYSVDGAPRY